MFCAITKTGSTRKDPIELRRPSELTKSRDDFKNRKATVFEVEQKPIKSKVFLKFCTRNRSKMKKWKNTVLQNIMLSSLGREKLPTLMKQVKPKNI